MRQHLTQTIDKRSIVITTNVTLNPLLSTFNVSLLRSREKQGKTSTGPVGESADFLSPRDLARGRLHSGRLVSSESHHLSTSQPPPLLPVSRLCDTVRVGSRRR